jgi:hypothetical protein
LIFAFVAAAVAELMYVDAEWREELIDVVAIYVEWE